MKVCSRRLVATSGGASCRNQIRLPPPSTIIGPPGPTGLIVTVLLLSGWTTGEGSGVSNSLPFPRARFELLLIVIFGGISPGSLTKCWSLSGWVAVNVSGPCLAPSVATVKPKRIGFLSRIRSTTATDSPWVRGWSGTKLAPRWPE